MKTFQELEQLSHQALPHDDSRDQLNRMVMNRSLNAFSKRDQKMDEIQDIESLQKHQAWIKESILKALGGLPSTSSPLNAKILRIDNLGIYKRENIVYESLDNVYVTANLYKPNFINQEKFPCILLACGHQKLGKHSEEYQWVAQTLVSYGFIVFVIDNFGQGERFSYFKEGIQYVEALTFEHDHAGYQASLLGDNIARYMVNDHMRAIDYLATRNDIDITRIGITGNSGGGTLSSLLMILEERIQAAAPATFITRRDIYQKTGQPQDREQHWFNLTELGFDHEDILLAFAPKPVRLLIADYDFFPIEGTLKTLELAEKGYSVYGANSNLSATRFAVEHSYPVEMAQEAAQFFQTVFNHKGHQVLKLHLDENCLCTVTGQVSSSYPDARFVYDLNLEHFENLQKQQKSTSSQKRPQLLEYFRSIVFKHRDFECFNSERIAVLDDNQYFRLEHWNFQSQVDMVSSLLWFRNKGVSNRLVLAVWSHSSSDLSAHEDFIWKCLENNKDVLVLDLSGEGYLQQRDLIWWAKSDETYGSLYKLNDDLFWLGDSLAALRSYEILQAIEWIVSQTKLPLEVHGFKSHSVYASVGCFLTPHTIDYHEHEGFPGYEAWLKSWVYDERYGRELLFPNLLRYGDINDLDCKKGSTDETHEELKNI